LSTCIKRVRDYLEMLTDGPLKEKSPSTKPIVAEPYLINVITDVNKANFVVEAHTGAGKTTLGLTLYHKARLGELAGYDVVYINMRGAGLEGRDLRELEPKLVRALFNHKSEEHAEVKEYIYATRELEIECKSFAELLSVLSQSVNKKLIVILDELERKYEWDTIARLVASWFSTTREFYDKTNRIPVKLVLPLPKVLKIREIGDALKVSNEAAYVFTEFRELRIDEPLLHGYVRCLADQVNPNFRQLLHFKGFKRLFRILSTMGSGRYIFPQLWKAIAQSICEAMGGQVPSDVGSFLRNKDLKFSDVDPIRLLGPTMVSICEGRPFGGEKRLAIEMWDRGFYGLLNLLGQGGIKPVRVGYQDLICKVAESLIWFTLKKKMDDRTIGEVVRSFLKKIPLGDNNKVIVLVPEFTRGYGVKETEMRIKEATKTRTMRLSFMYRVLTTEELLAIAFKGGGDLMLDSTIVGDVLDELKGDINSLLGLR